MSICICCNNPNEICQFCLTVIVKDRDVHNISSVIAEKKHTHNLCDSNTMHIFFILVNSKKLDLNKSISIYQESFYLNAKICILIHVTNPGLKFWFVSPIKIEVMDLKVLASCSPCSFNSYIVLFQVAISFSLYSKALKTTHPLLQ